MSGKAVGWAMEQRTGSPATKLVLVKLADNANEWVAWPTVAHIAADTELSPSNVRKQLTRLEALGLIRREERHEGGAQISNRYHLLAEGWVPRYQRTAAQKAEGGGALPGRGGLSQEEGGALSGGGPPSPTRRPPPLPRGGPYKPLSKTLNEPLERRAAPPVDRGGDPALWAVLKSNADPALITKLDSWAARPVVDGDRIVVDFEKAFAERYVRAERARVQAALGRETVFRYAGREGQP